MSEQREVPIPEDLREQFEESKFDDTILVGSDIRILIMRIADLTVKNARLTEERDVARTQLSCQAKLVSNYQDLKADNARLEAELDAMRISNEKQCSVVYLDLIEELAIPPGGSLFETVIEMKAENTRLLAQLQNMTRPVSDEEEAAFTNGLAPTDEVQRVQLITNKHIRSCHKRGLCALISARASAKEPSDG